MKKWPRFKLKKAIILIPIFLGIFSLLLSFQPQEIKTKTIIIESSPSPVVIPTKEPVGIQKLKAKATVLSTPIPTTSPTPVPSASTKLNINKVQVLLSINGQKFDLSIDEGKNQCEVLSEALAQGKISSLNMRYDENYKTYAVYQINGIGKENDVWWTYSVNGRFPSQGCSFIKAESGDKIEWKYTGS